MMLIKAIKKIYFPRLLLIAFLAIFIFINNEANAREIKVGFIYVSPIHDAGWSYAHEIGRQSIDKMPGVTTSL